jgi:prepilin-type N-terminal cleavage/methylation domain-containing protein
MRNKTSISTPQGFTLIELIAAMVIVSVAVAMAGVGFMSFEHIGKGGNARNAQLAQQRLELILAEKRKNGFPETGPGPDPCPVSDIDGCDLDEEPVFENSQDSGDCNYSNGEYYFEYCKVTVTIEGIPYTMRLYNYHNE